MAREDFRQNLDNFFYHFEQGLKSIAEDIEEIVRSRRHTAQVSSGFLEKRAQILIKATGEMLIAFEDEFRNIARNSRDTDIVERRQELIEKLVNFRTTANSLIVRINVGAQVLLDENMLSSETETKLRELVALTYDKMIADFKAINEE